MQETQPTKIPTNLLTHLHQHPNPQTHYLTIFTPPSPTSSLTPSPTPSYIIDTSPQKPPQSPLHLQSPSTFQICQLQLTQQNKKQQLGKFVECSCDEVNKIIQGFFVVHVGVEGYVGVGVELRGWRMGSGGRGKGDVVGVEDFGEILRRCRVEAEEIWSKYHGSYCRSFSEKKKKEGVELTSGILPFLQFEVLSLASPKLDEKTIARVSQLEGYNNFYSFIFPLTPQPNPNPKTLTKTVPQYLLQKHSEPSLTPLTPIPALSLTLFSSPRSSPTKIFNPHIYSKLPRKQKYELFTVKGMYQYYHYGDQGFGDNGWGCAYRSLQTILSWLNMQGYTDPMGEMMGIREIQERLDRFDRSRKLKGSSTWIGATEISWLIPSLTTPSLNCKILHIPTGARISQKYPELHHHFLTSGCPIMYGGGQYAYTIVGMHYSWKLGQCQFLVLDPHYTGEDDFGRILDKKGLSWRRPEEMFQAGVFYNFCLVVLK